MNDKLMVDQRELEYLLSIPVKVIEQYTSDRYVKDWRAKRVAVPPLPMVDLGPHTKRFVIARVMSWMEENFGTVTRAEAPGSKGKKGEEVPA